MIEEKAGESGASLTGRYPDLVVDPKMLEQLAGPTRFSRSATDSPGRTLTMLITVNNPTAGKLPYGFGIHPYFRLPWPVATRKTQVILPASKEWVLEQFLPTGAAPRVEARVDFRKVNPAKASSSTTF